MQHRKASRWPPDADPAPAPAAGPVPVGDGAVAALRRLLHLEAEIRQCASIEELNVLLVNEARGVTGARHAYAAEASGRRVRLVGASGSGTRPDDRRAVHSGSRQRQSRSLCGRG